MFMIQLSLLVAAAVCFGLGVWISPRLITVAVGLFILASIIGIGGNYESYPR
jgi:hypothetical protein